eukprot:362546-Chlamydomonas_euryale.AAC.3
MPSQSVRPDRLHAVPVGPARANACRLSGSGSSGCMPSQWVRLQLMHVVPVGPARLTMTTENRSKHWWAEAACSTAKLLKQKKAS